MSQQFSGRRRRRGGAFSPGDLFANGEQGAWYDPSDFATLYQDSAGTTPVTALGQPVGLMIDKSQGGKPTQEFVDLNSLPTPSINDFGGSSGSWDSATRTMSNTAIGTNASFPRFGFDFGLLAGKRYAVSGRLSGDLASVIRVRLATTGSSNEVSYSSTTGIFTAVQIAANDTIQFLLDGTQIADVTIEELSIREIPGNHAAQATTAARPTVQARKNLLERTEEFGTSPWGNSRANTTGTPPYQNVETAPDGTQTADALISASGETTAARWIYAPNVTASTTYTFSVYAKTGTRDVLQIQSLLRTGTAEIVADYNLSNGTISGADPDYTTAILDAGNGWYRCSFSFTPDATRSAIVSLYNAVGNGLTVPDDEGYMYFWGAQLEQNSTATTYQRVTTATDYQDIGLPRYLEFDGVDDAMATQSVDFTGTDEMTVCAGVEKLSDASLGVPVMLGSYSTNYQFGLFTPTSVGQPRVAFYSRGTTSVFAEVNNAAYAAPYLAVVTGLSDISEPSVVLRLNGAEADSDSGSQGTAGNYANEELNIGADYANARWFLSGRIHQLIIRGATTSGALLDQTEAFVARKTGVTL